MYYNNPYYSGAVADGLQTYKQAYQPFQRPIEPLIWVLNESEAVSYPVAANNTVVLWDKNMPTIYVKSADSQGVPSIRILDFTERQTSVPQNDYVKQNDFKMLEEKFNELTAKFEAMTEAKNG